MRFKDQKTDHAMRVDRHQEEKGEVETQRKQLHLEKETN